MAMDWSDLLFMHWRVPPELLRRLIPEGLRLDLFENEAWIGVVPFRMSGVRPRAPRGAFSTCPISTPK